MSDFFINPYSVVPSQVVASWGTNYKYWSSDQEGLSRDSSTTSNNQILADGNGNVYFHNTVSNDFLFMGTSIVTNSGKMFNISKINSSGNREWTASGLRTGTTNQTHVRDMTFDSNGRIVVCGTWRGNVGSLVLSPFTLNITGTNGYDWFFARLNTDGTWHSARSFGNNQTESGIDIATGVAADGSGNVYVCGQYVGSLTIDGTTITNPSTTVADIFLAKFNSSNNLVWLKGFGGTAGDFATNLTCDSSGNVYMTGNYSVAGFTVDSVTIPTPVGNTDSFVLKFNSSGTAQWAARVYTTTGTVNDFINGLDISSDGSYIVVGGKSGTPTIGTTFVNSNGSTITLGVGTGSINGYVAKLNSSGFWQWATRIAPTGGVSRDNGITVVKTLSNDSILAGGWFSAGSTITFSSNSATAASNGSLSYDGWFGVLDSSGVGQWVTRVGVSNDSFSANRDEFCSGLAQLDSQNIIVSNFNYSYNTPLTLGTQTISASLGATAYGMLVKQKINGTWEV